MRYLRCTDEACASIPIQVMAAWVELLDELESGGPLMREVVHDSLEIYGEQRMRSPVGGAHLRG